MDTILDSKQIAFIKIAENKKIDDTEKVLEKTRRSELSTSGIRRGNTLERREAELIKNNSSAMLRESMNMKPSSHLERLNTKNDVSTPKEDYNDFRRNPGSFSNILKDQEKRPDPVTPIATTPTPRQDKPENKQDWRYVSDNTDLPLRPDSSQNNLSKSTTFPSTITTNPYTGKPGTSAPNNPASGAGQGAKVTSNIKPTNSIIKETLEEDNWDDFDSAFNKSGQKRSDQQPRFDPKESKKTLGNFDDDWGDL